MDNLLLIDKDMQSLYGKGDKIIPLCIKWPLYELDIYNINGFWVNFKNKLNEINEKGLLLTPTNKEVNDFYHINSDIEFELNYTDDLAKKNFLFKVNDKIYSYVIGKKSKRSKKLYYVRFFFDLKEFFNY
jgi:hypothetical protein